MRIMYIIKALAMKAGLERVVSDKMNYLAEHGYEVSLVTYEQGEHPLGFPLHPSIRYFNLDARFFKLGEKPLWKRPFGLRKMRKRFKEGLQQAINQAQPDVIITTTYSMKVFDIILDARTTARRIIESHTAGFTVRKTYDYRNNPVMRRVAKLYDRWTFSRIGEFDKLVALTKGDAENWRQYIKDVLIIPNPVTKYPDSVRQHDGSGRRIISVGRLSEEKGFDMLIKAFALIADKCPDWHVAIFGNGAEMQKLVDAIKLHRLEGRVNILPPTPQIYDEYQQSEFYVLSSHYEGYPLVLNEAMSCGIPCVAFRIRYGPDEAITHGENGLLAESENIEDLAKQMLWMIEHTQERLAMGAAARVAARRYLQPTIMQQWEELFRQLDKSEDKKG